MDDRSIEFQHPELNKPVSAIGGDYLLSREHTATVDGGEVLYFTGFFSVDRSCCGVGGCAYALVPGIVVDWKFKTGENGQPVSRVQPVRNENTRRRIREIIQKADPLRQVTFL
ncbi:MAG: hypothetical protein ACQERN_12505 [Thermodesulfobacteriota bacterium]